jgi:hypothetical protein
MVQDIFYLFWDLPIVAPIMLMHHLQFRALYLGKPTNTCVNDVPLDTEENFDAFGDHDNDLRPTWLKNFTNEDLGKKSEVFLDFATSRFDSHVTGDS